VVQDLLPGRDVGLVLSEHRVEARTQFLFAFAWTTQQFRQLRPQVGKETQQRATILNLGLRFVRREVSVDSLEVVLYRRIPRVAHYS
jgi:hypothetical protein